MKIKRFFAKDMRTALNEVKATLGADAVIMSNKKVTGGIEIVAAVDYDAAKKKTEKAAPAASMEGEPSFASLRNKLNQVARQQPPKPIAEARIHKKMPEQEPVADSLQALLSRQNKSAMSPEELSSADESMPPMGASAQRPLASRQAPQPIGQRNEFERSAAAASLRPQSPSRGSNNSDMEQMKAEMAQLRKLLEHQLSGLMWQEVERREPMRAMLVKQLKSMGFADELADQLACYIPEDMAGHEAWPKVQQLVADQLLTNNDEIMRDGGIVALLGPTGVGKTTTIAKIAARYAMQYGVDQVALVTTDTYRIGAHEQLSTYGRILGCPVKVAKDADELANVLHQLRHRSLVLIDTAGMGQRDTRLTEQLQTLMSNSEHQIKNYLVLSATAQRQVLQEAVSHFRRIPLAGCIFTKLDECLSLGEILSVTIQNALPIGYLTDGQRVPEDIQVADPAYLVTKATELMESNSQGEGYLWTTDAFSEMNSELYD
ncbi:flagellar biosynthesis protein FlhF [Corallincola spongiicola]|uniref:Flagellar biosynthesis protein FlhF n=1 Tax=Corallincola spongiicola TaxID=2520508 RepID=A0ABY1WKT4_9GAMM|nr:flagellar biosynthesis protein FlhF [Corallincola spongiicola]TAA40302.1 flagellar biosynthesis protein FlhF [Corallincola spongiicola]